MTNDSFRYFGDDSSIALATFSVWSNLAAASQKIVPKYTKVFEKRSNIYIVDSTHHTE